MKEGGAIDQEVTSKKGGGLQETVETCPFRRHDGY